MREMRTVDILLFCVGRLQTVVVVGDLNEQTNLTFDIAQSVAGVSL